MSLGSQLKIMSLNQWKLLNQLKEYVNKSSSDKSALFVLSREWISLLQKLPSLYEDVTSVAKQTLEPAPSNHDLLPKQQLQQECNHPTHHGNSKATPKELLPKDSQSYNFPQVLNGLKLKINTKSNGDETDDTGSKWKTKKDVVSKPSISSRTKHVISSVATAESIPSRLKRLEDLTNHLHQYPESKSLAVKEGAIYLLLRLREEAKDEATLDVLREGLAVLGHIDPVPGRGIRILAIDGGGIRGVLVIEMLRKLEELTGKRIYELFDYICGVSTGAILACCIGAQMKTLDEVSELYKDMSKKIFSQNAFWGTSNLVWSHSYYNTEMWEQLLKTYVGETDLMKTSRHRHCPKVAAVSAVVNQARVLAFVFRNYALPYKVQSQYIGGYQHKLWEAARASAAAPSYFEEFRLGEFLHQDGGILVNNPCAVAIHEAKLLWPGNPLQCVVSFGTGRFSPVQYPLEEIKSNGSSSWKTKFLKILDSATDTEAVHTTLNDLLPDNVYYRFNPYLTEMVTMDEIRSEKISQLEMDAEMYYRRNEETFEKAVRALTESQTVAQRFQNWISLKRLSLIHI